MRYISDFKIDETIVEHYLCKKKQTLKSRTGKNYLSLLLQDKTGTINAKVWDLNNQIQSFEENDFIKIDATVLSYQNELQLTVRKIRRSQEGEYDPMDYIPSTDKNIEELYQKIVNIINSLKNNFIKSLLENIYIKNDTIREKFKTHSAAKTMHHSYMGGLLEHSLSICQICDFLSSHYPYVNRDLLLASALLHDVGKMFELSPFPDNDYTDDGQLLGHIVIGVELITKECNNIPDFPHQLQSLLKHSILSHHGEYEFGSPKRPKTIEAFILHCADELDAKLKIYEDSIFSDNTTCNWVGYHKMLARNLRKSNF
ncbi:3'-5' exoribonuclease YhaM family protein [[Clostridium] colinum]|uniref:3'-5' exoribonuclease YhaM family protein n=1 Tax=[Clostridium] colinum TaxID=36835 RepID=UPI0020254E35|nr:3'-5' exoribonuclease YhaM family protein [[Clostridium] colinum]